MPAHRSPCTRRAVGMVLAVSLSAGCGVADRDRPAGSEEPPGATVGADVGAPTSAVDPGSRPGRVLLESDVAAERSTAWADLTVQALGRVEQLWGRGRVAEPVRLVLPADAAGFTAATGVGPSDEVPAAVVGTGADARLVVHPDAWDRLTPEGRLAVLTHEVTHLAMQGDAPVPWWLGEGLAEYTAHRSSRLSVVEIADTALDRVRAGEVPRAWPEGRDDEAGTRWGRYAMAWLACRFLAEEHSERALMEIYRAVGAGQGVGTALLEVIGFTEQQTLDAWGEWLTELAAEGPGPRG